ncbi:hypothetical protein DXN04_05975 [Chitinophaga silvisoli]|uniref:Uncharacterized protein n=1 Tax=Chitinophaga silvisoli TaxID=2291814 RepID=A0A3E1PA51_9BACT|nr:hypothetical protein DXN04_05975 [Chitinophaga silvisoli]
MTWLIYNHLTKIQKKRLSVKRGYLTIGKCKMALPISIIFTFIDKIQLKWINKEEAKMGLFLV